MAHYNLFLSLMFVYGGTYSVSVLSEGDERSPCTTSEDTAFIGGIVVDCQGRGLTSLPPPRWVPMRTTSLLLQSNSITHLDNTSFIHAAELRVVSLAHNTIHSVHPDAFQYNTKLEMIDLEYNFIRLDNQSIEGPLFHNLNSLVELKLSDNDNGARFLSLAYPPNLFAGLDNLRSLSLDTFDGDLRFNGIFKETKLLTQLTLKGGVTRILNESFQDFERIKLKELTIAHASYFSSTEQGAFCHLKYLDSYSLNNARQGTKPTLESLSPFVGRNFTLLRFDTINRDAGEPLAFQRDSDLTRHLARYLSKICVQHFVFTSNFLFFVELLTISNPVWSRCLLSADLSDNPLLGNNMELLHMATMRSLQSVKLADRKYSFLNRAHDHLEYFDVKKRSRDTRVGFDNDNLGRRNLSKTALCIFKSKRRTFASKRIVSESETKESDLPQWSWTPRLTEEVNSNKVGLGYSDLHINIPRNLVIFDLHGFSGHSISLDYNVYIHGGGNLREIYYSDSGVQRLTGDIRGLDNVKIVDLSRNDGSELTPSFMSSFPNVSKLILSAFALNKCFLSPGNHAIFQRLSKLQHLDISHNGLYFIPPTLFSNNGNIETLSLANNRLKTFPFDIIRQLPNLQSLDFRFNSLLELSDDAINALERHASRVPNFSLLLQGNIFSCGCSSIRFLKWLQITKIRLDHERNYSCILENGQRSTTGDMESCLALWRTCEGKDTFFISIILASLMALGFSLFTLGFKFKTQLKATAFQYFNKAFVLMTPRDYSIGVYIGYADKETDFACMLLRELIETRFRLSTYLRHRDLLPASSIAECIIGAVNSSWRVVLVVTDDYLNDPWSYFAMKTATYSVGTSNPGRLVIVVFSDDVAQRIPVFVLNAVPEDRIITLKDGQQDFTSSQMEKLRSALSG